LLIVKELIRSTWEWHNDYEDLCNALRAMKQIADHINESMHKSEKTNKVVKIQSDLGTLHLFLSLYPLPSTLYPPSLSFSLFSFYLMERIADHINESMYKSEKANEVVKIQSDLNTSPSFFLFLPFSFSFPPLFLHFSFTHVRQGSLTPPSLSIHTSLSLPSSVFFYAIHTTLLTFPSTGGGCALVEPTGGGSCEEAGISHSSLFLSTHHPFPTLFLFFFSSLSLHLFSLSTLQEGSVYW
jgi:hypothetical protein